MDKKKQLLVAFAKWMQTKHKEMAKIPTEQLAAQLEQTLQTEEGVKQLTPYIQEFEKEMQSQSATMYASGGKLSRLNAKKLPLATHPIVK